MKKIFTIILVSTILLGIIPFLHYQYGRIAGQIPSEEEWSEQGYNHGPLWENSVASFTIALPMILLIILSAVTLFFGIYKSIRLRYTYLAFRGILLSVIQLGIFYLQLNYLMWVID
jgi:hypothetical protein